LGISLATIKLKSSKSDKKKDGFKIPGSYLIPIISSTAIIWLLSKLSQEKIFMFIGALVILSLVFFMVKLFSKK
jgi:hypothetical protein